MAYQTFDRVLETFTTTAGRNPPPDNVDILNLLPDWVPDESTRKRILVDNPARLYGF